MIASPAGSRPPFALPTALDGWAVFLDVDGTLIDIAPTPDAVVVPDGLVAALQNASRSAGGALALVSGRAIAVLDRLFRPAVLPAAGLHGYELRYPAGGLIRQPQPPALARLRPHLAGLAERFPGSLVEDKGAAIALHYRAVPEAGPALEEAVRALLAGDGEGLTLQPGKMVLELRPARAGKGKALETLMAMPPFAGRRVLAVGDDLTDEAMLAAAAERGGVGIRVGGEERPSAATHRLPDTAAVRSWLAAIR